MPNSDNKYDLSSLGATLVEGGDAAPSTGNKSYDLSSLGATIVKPETPTIPGGYGSLVSAGTGASNVIADAVRSGVLTAGEASKKMGGKGDYAQAISDWIKRGEYPLTKGHDIARLGGELTGGGVEALAAFMIPGMGAAGGESFAGKMLTSAAKGAVGGGLLGAAQMPESKVRGAELGAAFGVPLEMVPSALRSGIKKVTPEYANEQEVPRILNAISGGKTLEQNSKSIADDVKGSYKKIVKEGSGNYKKINDEVGKTSIYEMYRGVPKTDYLNIDKDIVKKYSPDIKEAHSDFMRDPTFENAHKLQNTIGSEVRYGQKLPSLNLTDRATLKSYSKARSFLKNDMDHFLKRTDDTGKLSADYKSASDFHRNEVIPYRETTNINKIANEKVTNPRNVTTLFKNPESNVQKVVDDIGPHVKDKIIYNELGKLGKDASPEKLIKAYDGLDKKGLSSYVSPSLETQMEHLRQKVAQSILVKRGVGALIGSGIMHGIPIPGAGEAAGAIGGAILGPKFLGKGIGKIAAAGGAIAGEGSPFYRTMVPRSLIPTMIRSKKRGELT